MLRQRLIWLVPALLAPALTAFFLLRGGAARNDRPAGPGRLIAPTQIPVNTTSGQRADRTTIQRPVSAAGDVSLFSRDAPQYIVEARRVVLEHGILSPTMVRELISHQQAHPGDGRPDLLLAEDRMNDGMRESAVNGYERATRDPRSIEDPRMLEDLVQVAGAPYASRHAADVIVKAYGRRALDSVRVALAEASKAADENRTSRLAELAERLNAEQVRRD
jgi:hypothetical protein